MDQVPDYLKPLEYIVRPFPREAVEAAIERREEAIPYLLRTLEWVEQNAEEVLEDYPGYMLHIYALYLLAQFRETRAYPLIVRLFRHPEAEPLTGDISTEGLANMLASVCGGDPGPIKSIIEDRELDELVRGAGLKALGILAHTGALTNEEVSGYFGTLYNGGLEREPAFVWDPLISVCATLGMTEHLEDIRRLYREGIADPYFEGLKDVELDIHAPPGGPVRQHYLRKYHLIDDTVAEMKWWHCFTKEAEQEENIANIAFATDDPDSMISEDYDPTPLHQDFPAEAGIPYQRETPKIGRNDPCPCGSGKKFKKCCGGT